MKVIDQINGSAFFAQSAYSASIATKDSLGQDITATYITAIEIPESANWNETSTTVQTNSSNWNEISAYQNASSTYLTALNIPESANWEDTTDVVQTNSGDWDRISALSGYSAEGWQVKLKTGPKIYASATLMTASGIAPVTGLFTVSGGKSNWVSITQGGIYMYNLNRGLSAQYIRPDTIEKWNHTTDVVQTNSADWGAGSTPTYDYTDNNLISAIDTSGLFATSAGTAIRAISANALRYDGTMGANIIQSLGNGNDFIYMPKNSPWGSTVAGIFSPLQFATGACLAMNGGSFAAFLKGNEWYVSNRGIGQALRGETHQTRGVHLSGATTAGNSFDLSINAVRGTNETANNYNWKLERGCVSGKGINGEWRYGPAEDTALRTASSWNDTIDVVQANSATWGQGGGGDVPTGTMNVSGLEYNAVGEISAYGNSAIAQYGAEKQWLVHDDTIVHISNSAQYAFGCNVSALQRLMGIDETVLWEGSANDGTLNFTDPLTSFKEFKFYVDIPERGTNKVLTFYDAVNTVTPGFIQLTTTTMTNGSVVNDWWQGVYNLNATLNTATYKSMTIYANGQYYKQCSTTACGTNASKLVIKKVIGIGRKA